MYIGGYSKAKLIPSYSNSQANAKKFISVFFSIQLRLASSSDIVTCVV